ncbi:MAG: hypothetical protein HY709_00420 [Candidatus Latescibacteria bacterium]|nr:hypothetical protein [Candidatus Latescibacterota bacterium]
MSKDKEAIDGGYDRVKNTLLKELRTLFQVEGHTYDDLKQSLANWFNGLDANQRDPNADWHSHESKPLVMHLGTITDVEETLFAIIPSSGGFGLGRVRDWTRARTTDYLTKFNTGKAHIEDNCIKVPVPEWNVEGEIIEQKQTGKAVHVSYRSEAKIRFGKLPRGAKIYVTSSGEDPRREDAQRQEIMVGEELQPFIANSKIQFVERDTNGNYSPVTTIVLVNEDTKHEIHPPRQLGLDEMHTTFVFPKDPEGLRISARTLFESAIELNIADKETIQELLIQLVKELGKS